MTQQQSQYPEFGLRQGVDAIALSFVRSAADVNMVREIVAGPGSDTPLIAKLEKPQPRRPPRRNSLRRRSNVVVAAIWRGDGAGKSPGYSEAIRCCTPCGASQ